MDILKAATDWARTEVFSTSFFILLGIIFLLVSLGFWQLGKSEMAKAYVVPMSVAGTLLLIIGVGLSYTNLSRISDFEAAYHQDASAFIESEISRSESTLNEYKTVVFTAIPIIIAACSIGILVLNTPVWRARLITTIAMMVVILLIDGTAHTRMQSYYKQLNLVKNAEELRGAGERQLDD